MSQSLGVPVALAEPAEAWEHGHAENQVGAADQSQAGEAAEPGWNLRPHVRPLSRARQVSWLRLRKSSGHLRVPEISPGPEAAAMLQGHLCSCVVRGASGVTSWLSLSLLCRGPLPTASDPRSLVWTDSPCSVMRCLLD